MSYAAEEAQFNEDVASQLTDSPALPTTYAENFQYGIGQTIDQSLSVSDYLVREFNGLAYSDRNDELNALRQSGTLSDEIYESFVEPDNRGLRLPNYSAMADYANEMYGANIRNDDEIQKELREGIETRQRQAQDIFERQTAMGATGEILGSLTGFALEPAGIAAIPLEALMIGRHAYTLSQATTRLARASRIAAISASANMITETAIQPIVFNWREQIGVDMTWEDSLLAIASVGVLSGAITGAASGLKTKKRFRGEQLGRAMEQSLNDPLTIREVAATFKSLRQATAKIDDEAHGLLRQTEDELNSVPDGSAREHFEQMQAAESRANDPPLKQENIDVEYELNDAQLDAEFNARLTESESLRELTYGDIAEDLTPAQKIQKASDAISDMRSHSETIKLCLTGGK